MFHVVVEASDPVSLVKPSSKCGTFKVAITS